MKEAANPMGWPMMVFSVFKVGKDLIESLIGYGVMRIPMENGSYHKEVRLFRPVYSENKVGIAPEFVNSELLATTVQRGHIQTKSEGSVLDVDVNVLVF